MKGIYNVSKKPNSCWTKKQGNWASKGNFKKPWVLENIRLNPKEPPPPNNPLVKTTKCGAIFYTTASEQRQKKVIPRACLRHADNIMQSSSPSVGLSLSDPIR